MRKDFSYTVVLAEMGECHSCTQHPPIDFHSLHSSITMLLSIAQQIQERKCGDP